MMPVALDPVAWLMPGPAPLALLLAALCVAAWRRPPGPRPALLRAALGLATAWCWILATPAVGNLLVRDLEGDRPASQDAPPRAGSDTLIVVLASGRLFTGSGEPRPEFDADGWDRFHAALGLWRRTGGTLLFTGGPGHGPADSFGHLMERLAIDAGVPSSAIRVTTGSRTTFEDLREASAVIRAHAGPSVLVTSAMHMPRALAVARALGLRMTPHRCAYRQIVTPTWKAWLPNNGTPDLWRDALHEVLGLRYYRLRGWAA